MVKLLKDCVCVLSVWFFATSWTVARQAPLSMEFCRQEYWSGLTFPTPGDLSNPGTEPRSLVCDSRIDRQILHHCTTWEAQVFKDKASLLLLSIARLSWDGAQSFHLVLKVDGWHPVLHISLVYQESGKERHTINPFPSTVPPPTPGLGEGSKFHLP